MKSLMAVSVQSRPYFFSCSIFFLVEFG